MNVCVCVCAKLYICVCVCLRGKMRILVLLPDHEKRRIKSEVKCLFPWPLSFDSKCVWRTERTALHSLLIIRSHSRDGNIYWCRCQMRIAPFTLRRERLEAAFLGSLGRVCFFKFAPLDRINMN